MTHFIVHLRSAYRAIAALALGSTLLALTMPNALAQPTVAFTFDDGFNATPGNATAMAYNNAILATLRQQGIRAILFPHGALVDNPDSMALVRAWGRSEHAVGNHTYSHAALSTTDTLKYLDDVQRAQHLLETLPGWCPLLRFPYLDEGKTDTQRQHVLKWLARHGYGVAPATITVPDWELAKHYQDLLDTGDASGANNFRNAYVRQVINQAVAQEVHWQAIVKRSPAHVLLLHANPLNAAALPDIITAFQSKGWQIIDAVIALNDPIYQRSLPPDSPDAVARPLPTPNCR